MGLETVLGIGYVNKHIANWRELKWSFLKLDLYVECYISLHRAGVPKVELVSVVCIINKMDLLEFKHQQSQLYHLNNVGLTRIHL